MAKTYINASKNAGLKTNRITRKKKKEFINVSARDEKNRGGLLEGAGYLLGSGALGVAGVVEGAGDILAAGSDLLRGDTAMAKYRFMDNDTAEAQQKLTEWYNPNKAMQVAGDVSSGIGNSLVFMLPYVGPYLAAAGYTGMGISNAAEKTGDVGLKEIGYGAVSGGMEFALDKLTGGIGKASKNVGSAVARKLGREASESVAKATGKTAASKLAGVITGKTGRGLLSSVLIESGKGALGEAVEESLTEIIDPALLKIFHVDENAELDWKQVAYAGLIGGLSGGLMTAGPAAVNYQSSVKAGRSIRESGQAESMVNYAKTTAINAATRKRERYKAAGEQKLTPKEDATVIGKTYTGAKNLANSFQNGRAESRVKAMAEKVDKNVKAYESYMSNPKKTEKELEVSDAILGELRGNLFLLENATLLEVYEEAILELDQEDKQELVNGYNARAKELKGKSDYTVADLDTDNNGLLTAIAAKYMTDDQYGELDRFFQKRKNATAETQTTETTPKAATQPAQDAEEAKAEQVPTQNKKPVTPRFAGNGQVKIEGGRNWKDLKIVGDTNAAYSAYKAAEILAPNMGTDIEIHENLDKDGRQVNGYFDQRTNTLHININARRGTSGKQIALYTLGHEATHYVREWSGEKYDALADFVFNHLGGDAETLITDKLATLRTISDYQTMTDEALRDLAREEVVADGMELILTDGKVLDELARTDRSLWQRVKAWIQNIIAKIKKAYGDLNQASKTAQTLRETLDTLDEVERLFTESVREAGERVKTAEPVTSMNEENVQVSGKKLSVGDIDNRTFTYKELVAKGDIVGVVIDKNQQVPLLADGNIDTQAVLKTVRSKCESVPMKGGGTTYYVNVPDIGRNVRITGDGITHGFKAKRNGKHTTSSKITARATLELPYILENSIEANRLTTRGNQGILFSRVMIGTVGMEDTKGNVEYYAVRMVVEERTDNESVLVDLDILGDLYAANAKKVDRQGHQGITRVKTPSGTATIYAYNITHFLNDVKGVFKNTFSNDVYQTLGTQRKQDDFSKDLKYSIEPPSDPFQEAVQRMHDREQSEASSQETDDSTEAKTVNDHMILADTMMSAAQSEQEYRAVKRYKAKAEELADAEARRKELRRKAADVTRQIEQLQERKKTLDSSRPEPEVKETEAWIDNELNEAKSRKQSYMQEMDEISDMLRTETGKLLSLSAAKPLQRLMLEEQKKSRAMERSAERAQQREQETKEWAKSKVREANERANEKAAGSREWAKETVKKVRAEERARADRAESDAQDYKAAIHKTSMEKVDKAQREAREYKNAVYQKAYEKADQRVAKAQADAQDYKNAIYKTSMDKVYRAKRDATEYKNAVYRKAYEKAEQRVQKEKERFQTEEKYRRNRRELTAREIKARRVIGRLNTLFYSPTKTKHVPADLQALVEKVLKSENARRTKKGINAEKLDQFKELKKNMREMVELEAEIEKLERNPARTAIEESRLQGKLAKYAELEGDVLSPAQQAADLYAAFETWMNSREDGQKDQALLDMLKSQLDEIQEAPLSEMTIKSLTAVEEFYKRIYHQITTVNNTFATKNTLRISDLGQKASTEAAESKPLKVLSPTGKEWAAMSGIRNFFWKNLKPLTVFEAIGSKTFADLFQNVLNGEDTWARDIVEAYEFLKKTKKKYGYDKWDLTERTEITTADGTKVALTLGERMSLYAYKFREQAEEHLRAGGFVLSRNAKSVEKFRDGKIAYEAMLNDQTKYNMTPEAIEAMAQQSMTEEQRKYAEDVQQYLTSLGAKGNEVSRALYGLNLFSETAYFPLKSYKDYLTASAGPSGDPNIKNRGSFKETVPGADNPITLEDFMSVTTEHINSMATYHAFVLPMEDLMRVWNYKPVNYKLDENGEVMLNESGLPIADNDKAKQFNSLKAEITKKYGHEANEYILQLMRDLNGGARRDAAASILDKGLSAFKQATTTLSASTIIQQPTSIFRALAYIEAKHFQGAEFVDWETVKKYAPVASIKEMGGYDTGTGVRTSDYLSTKEYDNTKEKIVAMLKPKIYGGDPKLRAEAFGWLTSKADEATWRYLFGAVVNEQAQELKKDKKSEEVLKAAGKRFEEIVRRTQVYDSTLTRSEYMRSKDGLMKMATVFGAEPSTVVSMLTDGWIRAQRGDKAFMKKTAGAVALTVVANAVAASLIYAMRDDDEDKTFGEKYLTSLTSEIIEGVNLLEYLPVARDVVSLFKGYDIERTDMTLVSNLLDQVELITNSKRSVMDKIFGVSGAVAAFFGVPISNVYRDAKGLVSTTIGLFDAEPTTGAGVGYAVGDAVKSQFGLVTKLLGPESGNAYELYRAVIKGDSKHFARVAARYESSKDVELALRKELRENDPRITEAALARINGDLDVYESLVDQIESEGKFDRNIAIRAINNQMTWIKNNDTGATVPQAEEAEDTPEALYTASDLNAALERGDAEDFEMLYYVLLTDKKEQGKTEAQARSSIKSSVTSYWKKQYLAAWEANDTKEIKRIQSILLSTGLYGTRNDVATTGQEWVKAYAASKIKT